MKKAFTLIEIIVAITIFSAIIIYMYQAIYTTRKTTIVYERQYDKTKRSKLIKKLIYNDIFNQTDPYKDTSIKTTDKKYSTYYLKTNNSLHSIPSPYVAYGVVKKKLFRYESIKQFQLPLKKNIKSDVKIDELLSNVDQFVIYSYKNSKIIEYIINKKRTFFEISLPYSKKIIVVEGDTTTEKKKSEKEKSKK